MSWNEVKPEPNDFLRDLGPLVRSQKGSLDTWLQKHFYWSDSTSSGGITRLSTTSGATRAFVGTTSQLSSSETGRFFITSGTSRLYALTPQSGETGTLLMGSARALVALSATKQPATSRWLAQSGTQAIAAGVTESIVFTTAYSVAPTVAITPKGTDVDSLYAVTVVSASGFSASAVTLSAAAATGDAGIYWRSEGTVAL